MTDLSHNPAITTGQKTTATIGRLSMSDMWAAVTNSGLTLLHYLREPAGTATDLTRSQAHKQFVVNRLCRCQGAQCQQCQSSFRDIYPDNR